MLLYDFKSLATFPYHIFSNYLKRNIIIIVFKPTNLPNTSFLYYCSFTIRNLSSLFAQYLVSFHVGHYLLKLKIKLNYISEILVYVCFFYIKIDVKFWRGGKQIGHLHYYPKECQLHLLGSDGGVNPYKDQRSRLHILQKCKFQ